jgi:hypothetical protein
MIGLIGIVGIAGALMANVAGRMADGTGAVRHPGRRHSDAAGLACLWLGGSSIWWFLLGFLVVDGAAAGLHISNQNVVYALAPEAARASMPSI